MNPHHAISAPLGMMRYEDDGDYVLYSATRAREDALLAALKLCMKQIVALCSECDVPDDAKEVYRKIKSTR